MARLPDDTALGAAPELRSGRPIASAELGAPARALAEAGQMQAKAMARLGAGLTRAGEAVQDWDEAQTRYELARAKSQGETERIELDSSLERDQDYATLPQRYEQGLAAINARVEAGISRPRARELYRLYSEPLAARALDRARDRAFRMEGNATLAADDEDADRVIDAATRTDDREARTRLIDSRMQAIDALAGRGFITPQQAAARKQGWAQRYALADGIARADRDPDGVVNDLRAAPGTAEETVNRILKIEGEGKNARSSATGAGQFIDSTWLGMIRKYRPDLAEGRSDEDILGMRADRALGREMTARYTEENAAYLQRKGLPATPGQVYLAHFLGPAGAAAVLQADPRKPVVDALAAAVGDKQAKAMVEANPSILAGQQAGSVAGWADAKMGGADSASIYRVLRPEQRAQLLAHAEAAVRRQTVGDFADFKGRVADTESEAMNTGRVASPISRGEFVARLGWEAGGRAYAQHEANVQLGRDLSQVAQLDTDEQTALLEAYEPKPGPGFASAAKRREVVEKAIAAVRKARASDPEFKERVESTIAEAQRTGAATAPVEEREFHQRLGGEQGSAAYAAYRASLQLGRDLSQVASLSPQEQDALVSGYTPQPGSTGFEAQALRQDQLAKAIGRINKEKADDPAAFALKRLPAVREGYAAFVAAQGDPNASLEDKQRAARGFAERTLLEQARVGVPAHARRIVPEAYADALAERLSNPKAAGGAGNVAAGIAQEARLWGEHWPLVYRDVAAKAGPVVRVVGSGVKPLAAQVLTEFNSVKLGDIANDQDKEKLSTIRKDVRDAFKPFVGSFTGSEGSQPLIDDFQAAGEKLAAYYVRQGEPSAQAAKKAYDDLIGHKYEIIDNRNAWTGFGDSYRIPKGIPQSRAEIERGARLARGRLGAFGLAPVRDTVGGLSAATLAQAPAEAYADGGAWVTAGGAQSDQGLWMVYRDQVVRKKDGQPLFLSWEQLAAISRGRVE